MRSLSAIFLLCTIGFVSQAQLQVQNLKVGSIPNNRVSGIIEDQEKKPLASITVCLIGLPEKTSIILARTDQFGSFSFQNVEAGNYLIQALKVGTLKKLSEPFRVQSLGETRVEPIIMALQSPHRPIQDSLKDLSRNL